MRRFLLIASCAACTPGAVHFDDPLSGEPPGPPQYPIDAQAVPMRVAEGELITCASPSGGFERRVSEQPPSSVEYLWSSGLMVGDLDGDGLHDLVSPAEPFAQMYLGRHGGGARAVDTLLPFDLSFGTGGSLADYDGDGDLDVLLVRYERANVLLRNDGTGAFTDVSDNAGISSKGPSTASAWGDIDRDGDLDLFIGRYGDLVGDAGPAPSLLYENRGDGTFADRSHLLPDAVQRGWTRTAGWHDLNVDGYPELIVINDVGDPSVLAWNVGGRLFADPSRAGLESVVRGAGLGVGDLNGDGVPDLLVSEWDRLSLLESDVDDDGEATWVDYASAKGLVPARARDQVVPWGAELADLDNDGDLDAVVAFGHFRVDGGELGWANPESQPDAVFLQEPDGGFVDVAPAWGLDDRGVGRGFVVADLNDDGSLDLVKRDLDGPSVLYLSRCAESSWLKLRLRQPGSANPFAVGATVRVTVGRRMMQRAVTAGSTGFGTGGPPELHFGLGEADVVDRVEVIWPDGSMSVDTSLAVRRTSTLSRDDAF